MSGHHHPEQTRRLVELVENGETIVRAARRVGLGRSAAWRRLDRLGQAVRRRRRPFTTADERAEIEQLVLEDGLSIRATARRVGRAFSTVHRVVNLVLEREDTSRFRPRRLPRVQRCPTCNRDVCLWPCVACASLRSSPRG